MDLEEDRGPGGRPWTRRKTMDPEEHVVPEVRHGPGGRLWTRRTAEVREECSGPGGTLWTCRTAEVLEEHRLIALYTVYCVHAFLTGPEKPQKTVGVCRKCRGANNYETSFC